MGFEKEYARKKDEKMEQIKGMLSDALSLVILLENDMEIQKVDGVYARILRMIHEKLKDMQKALFVTMGQEEE